MKDPKHMDDAAKLLWDAARGVLHARGRDLGAAMSRLELAAEVYRVRRQEFLDA